MKIPPLDGLRLESINKLLKRSPVMLSPFALHLRTALSEAEGAQGRLREASAVSY